MFWLSLHSSIYLFLSKNVIYLFISGWYFCKVLRLVNVNEFFGQLRVEFACDMIYLKKKEKINIQMNLFWKIMILSKVFRKVISNIKFGFGGWGGGDLLSKQSRDLLFECTEINWFVLNTIWINKLNIFEIHVKFKIAL